MRFISILLLALALTSCDLPGTEPTTVDAAALAPMNSRERSLIYAADGAAQQKNYAAAERDYLAGIAEKSGHVEAHLGLAQLYLRHKQPDKALPVLERALTLQPENALANYLIGKLYLDSNALDEAGNAFDRGLTTQPDNLDLALGKGITEDMLGNHYAAQMQYLRAIKLNPTADLIKIRTNLAMSYLLAGEPKKAVELLKDEAIKPSASSVTRHNLALAYGLLGQHTKAKKLLNGEIDEETRQLTIARMREYNSEHGGRTHNPSLKPAINEIGETIIPAPEEAVKPTPAKKSSVSIKPTATPGKKADTSNNATPKTKE